MAKLTKRMRLILDQVDRTQPYRVIEAIIMLKKIATTNFIESVDVAVNLGIDARKSDHNIRDTVVLPHGTGRRVRIAVFTQGSNVDKAKDAGADIVGMDEVANKIKQGDCNFDVVIASPDAMYVVGQLGQILGPRGLMPNPKFGTITSNIAEAVKNFKYGKIRYRNEKNGIIHAPIGNVEFEDYKLKENLETILIAIKKAKPIHVKGVYIKKVSLSTTMGAGVEIDQGSLCI